MSVRCIYSRSSSAASLIGIFIKTAATLINEFGDLDELLRRSDEIKQPKRRQALIDNTEQIKISRELVTLDSHTPLKFSYAKFKISIHSVFSNFSF